MGWRRPIGGTHAVLDPALSLVRSPQGGLLALSVLQEHHRFHHVAGRRSAPAALLRGLVLFSSGLSLLCALVRACGCGGFSLCVPQFLDWREQGFLTAEDLRVMGMVLLSFSFPLCALHCLSSRPLSCRRSRISLPVVSRPWARGCSRKSISVQHGCECRSWASCP